MPWLNLENRFLVMGRFAGRIWLRPPPEQDFIGGEVHLPGVGALLKEIADRGLENIRIIPALMPNHVIDRVWRIPA